MSETLSLDVAERIGVLRLTREDKRNALDAPMLDALAKFCREIERRNDLDILVLTGSKDSFCAGGDIRAWSGESPDCFGRHWIRDGHLAFDALARLRQPVIAVLNGSALGGGLELAACADYRIAERHVRLGFPETRLGIIPGWSGTQRCVRRFGAQTVRRMALCAEVFDAAEARHLGVVDAVVETGAGLVEGQALAARMLRRAPGATELTKMLINAAEGEERERVLEALAGRIAASSDELQEGLAAYRERRAPDFREKHPLSKEEGR